MKYYTNFKGIQNNPIEEKQNNSVNQDNKENISKGDVNTDKVISDDKTEENSDNKETKNERDNKEEISKNDNGQKKTANKGKSNVTKDNANQEKSNDVEEKKKDIDNNQSNEVSSTEDPLIAENNRLRENIKNKYGVNVGFKDEIDGNYINSYVTPTKQYDDQKINKVLNTIDAALGKYPKGFFYEISSKWKPVTIYLVEKINSSAAGLTDNRNVNTVIILINTEGFLFESTLHHEIMHYIDCYLATIVGASELENSMNNYNPSGFVYGNQTNEYVYYYSNQAYFLSAYSKSNYKEDRAVLFADMMYRSLKKDYYSLGNPINEKAKVISNQLEKYFDCVSSSTNEYWGRFIEW